MPGVSAAFDAVGFAICNSDTDVILCPAPFYLRIGNDFAEHAGVEVIPVQSIDPQSGMTMVLRVENFQKIYDECRQQVNYICVCRNFVFIIKLRVEM